MSKRRILAGFMGLLLLITSVYTGNVVVRAEDTAGKITVNFTGNGTLDYVFYDSTDAQCQAGGYGRISYDSESKTFEIPNNAVKMVLKASADQNWQTGSASGTKNGTEFSDVDRGIFGENGKTITEFTYADGFTINLTFTEQQEPQQPASGIQFEIGNSQNGEVYYSFTGAENSWVKIDNNQTINETIANGTTIYVKAVPNSEQSVDTTDGANYVDIAGARTTFTVENLTSGAASFTYDESKAHKVHIEFAGSSSSANAGDIPINIVNALNGVVQYKIGTDDWKAINGSNFTLRKSEELKDATEGTTILFQATPKQDQSLDTNQGQNWIQIGGQAQTDISTEQLIAGTYSISYDPTSTYSMQIKFNGGGQQPTTNTGDIAIDVKNAQGTSAAYYRIGDTGEFTKIEGSSLTLSASSELNGVEQNTKIWFKADIDSSQVLDEHNQNWYCVGNAETQFALDKLANGSAYIEYNPNNAYNVQIAFDGGNGGGEQQDVSFSCTSMNGNENERVNAVEVWLNEEGGWVNYSGGALNSLTEPTTFKVRINMKDGFTIDKVSLDYESFDRSSRVGYFKESNQPDYDAIIAALLSDAGYEITFQPEEDSKDAGGKSTLQADSTCLNLQYQTAIAYDESVNINWFFQTKDGDHGYGVWTIDENRQDVFVDGVGDSEVIFSFNGNNYGENGEPLKLGYGKENTGENPIQVSYDSAYKGTEGQTVTVTPDTYDYFSAGGYTTGTKQNTIHLDDYEGLIDEVYIDVNGDNTFEASEKLTAKVVNDPHIGEYSYYEETLDAAASYNILVRKHKSTRVSLKWSYTEPGTDYYVDNGKIFIEKVVRGNETLYEAQTDGNGDLVLENGIPKTTTNELLSDYHVSSTDGEVLVECGDKVTIRLIPTYGYQIKSATLNGVVQLTPNDKVVSSFTFTVGGNLHMAGTFVEGTDETDTNGAEKIRGAGIADGRNATDSGNLKLTVADHSGNYAKESEALNLAKGENANATTIATLDMTLDSMVSKGNGQYWTDNITSFTHDIKVNLDLNDTTYEPGDTYVIVREHGGQLEKLETIYSNGMLEVPTNKFSTYSIVKIPVAEEDRPNMHLIYDDRGYDGNTPGSVTVKDSNDTELVGTDGYFKYADSNQKLTFELVKPGDRVGCTPVVEVVFPQENDADTVVIEPTVTNNTFTVTPSTDSGLTGSPFMEVYVHWSAYDSVGPDEDQFMVILRKESDADTFVFQNNPTVQSVSLDGETKYIFANGTNASVEIIPGANRELVEVNVDTNGQLTHYSAEPQEGDRNIAELKTSDGKFVVPNLAPWTFVEAICIDLPVLSNIQLTDSSQTLYDTMKRSEVGISATCTLGDVDLAGTVELDGGDELLAVGENEYKVIFTSNPNEQGEQISAEGTITLKVLHKVDISGLGWTGTTFTYNGTAQGPTFTNNLPEEVQVASTRDDSQVNKGNYTAVASITLANGYSNEFYKLVNPSSTTGIFITEGGAIATVTKDWSITAKDLAAAEVTLDDALTYNGAQQNQTIASVKIDGRTLTEGTDYTVSGNTGTNVNTYTLTITGEGNYTGTASKDWSIGKKSISGATITLDDALTYNGAQQNQTVSSVKLGESTLTATTDYTISGNTQKDAGTYTLTVTGNGNYSGTVTKQFSIEKKTVTPKLTGTVTKTYDNTTTVPESNSLSLTVTGTVSPDTLTVNAASYAYDDSTVGTGKTITATGITISGDAAKNYTLSGTNTTVVGGTITQTTPTITLSNLSETTQAPTGVKATLNPADATATVVVKYEVVDEPAVAATPEVPCNVEHEEGCASLTEGNTCDCAKAHTSHDSECGYQAATSGTPATYKWVTTRPTTPGTYNVHAYMPTGTANVAAIPEGNAVTGTYTLTQYTAPSGGGSDSGADSGSSGSSASGGATKPAPTTPTETVVITPAATENTTTRRPAVTTEESNTETTSEETIGVSSEDGAEGWTDIKTEIHDKLAGALETEEGEELVVAVEMNGEDTVPSDVFEAIEGQDITVTFDMGNGIVWAVNGMDVTAGTFKDINFGALTGEGVTDIPAELVSNLTENRFSVELTLEFEGEFGFTAVMTVNVDKKNAGKYANLFYFNPETESMEYICSAPVKEDGTTDLTFVHASDYIIVVDDIVMSVADNVSIDKMQEAAPQETPAELSPVELDTAKKDAFNPLWIIVIGIVVLLIGGIAIFAVKRKTE